MNAPDMPVQVPIDNPNADTEWNDILRAHKIIPEKPKDPEPAIQEALLAAHQRAHDNRLEDRTLSELDDLEDLEDDDFLKSYRQKRLTELNELSKASKFGSVLPLQKAEYAREVTEASRDAWVVVVMGSNGSEPKNATESRVLEQLLPRLASKYPEIKVLSIRADLCVENYPERNTPTILIYRDTNIAKQVVTLGSLNGVKTSLRNLELLLVEVGAVKEGDTRLRDTDADGDPGEKDRRTGMRSGGIRQGARVEDGEDDDWD
jgi:hypothetical protein